MKYFKDYICYKNQVEDTYNNMVEYFDGDIPSYILNEFEKDPTFDYILESLKTHDYQKLQDKLKTEYPKDILYFEEFHENSFLMKLNYGSEHILKQDMFKDILMFFNYTLRQKYQDMYLIEPIYSRNVSNYVYKDCKGIVYHFTGNESADSILKNGLRIKGTYGSRNIPKRIYLYASPTPIDINKKDRWYWFAKSVVNMFKAKRQGIAVLKIDLNRLGKTNIEFYKDTVMGDDEAIFTLNNIPKELITKLT